jgi:hypothetical protein
MFVCVFESQCELVSTYGFEGLCLYVSIYVFKGLCMSVLANLCVCV